MKKVLHVIRNIGNGGTEKYMINLITNPFNNVQNFILTYGDITCWNEELNKNNVEIFHIDDPAKIGINSFYKKFKKIIKDNKIDIVYSYTHYNSGLIMLFSYLLRIKLRITHSHRTESINNNSLKYKIYKLISKLLINIFSNKCLACGIEAKKSLFYNNKDVLIINNGINIKEYEFDNDQRIKFRKKLNIDDKTHIIGTVGRIDENKNHKFLVDIFKEYHKNNKNSKLIIIGDGEKREELELYIKSNKLSKDILLLGNRKDVNSLYNIFDLFMLTSYKEGLPFVLIEAQTNGLNCIVSDSVDKNSDITNSITFLSLNSDMKEWVNVIEKKICIRNKNTSKIIQKGYSIDDTVKIINNMYYS